jgi:hypothetical protein
MFQNIIQNKNCSIIPPLPGPTYWPTHQNRHPDILYFFYFFNPQTHTFYYYNLRWSNMWL